MKPAEEQKLKELIDYLQENNIKINELSKVVRSITSNKDLESAIDLYRDLSRDILRRMIVIYENQKTT